MEAALGIGLVGAGFNARFHLQSLVSVRQREAVRQLAAGYGSDDDWLGVPARLRMPLVTVES